MVCHDCGEPLPSRGQFCSHCGRRRSDWRRGGRATRLRAWLWAMGFLAVALPLSFQFYWRQQGSVWKQEARLLRPLPAPPPPQDLAMDRDGEFEEVDPGRLARSPMRSASGRTGVEGTGISGPGRVYGPEVSRLTVAVAPDNVTTYVYLNGGSLLGRAPVLERAVRPGQHRVVLWAPAIRGRAIRTVTVEPGGHARLITSLVSTAPMTAAGVVR